VHQGSLEKINHGVGFRPPPTAARAVPWFPPKILLHTHYFIYSQPELGYVLVCIVHGLIFSWLAFLHCYHAAGKLVSWQSICMSLLI